MPTHSIRSWLAGRAAVAVRTTSALACLLLVATRASAQGITTGAVTGTVVAGEEPLAEVRVMLLDGESQVAVSETDDAGRFAFRFLDPGSYAVQAERIGYRPARVADIPVHAGRSLSLRITLAETEPPASAIDTSAFPSGGLAASAPGSVTLISGPLLDVPGGSRSVADLWALAPGGPSAGPRIRPSPRSAAVGLLVDGLEYSQLAHPALSTRDSHVALFTPFALAEAEVLLNAPDVELGGSGGPMLRLSTRRGGRRLEVQGFGDWTGDALWSSRHGSKPQGSFNTFRGGVNLTGPIIPDTAMFAIGFEVQRVQRVVPRAWVESASDASLLAATEAAGLSVAPYLSPRVETGRLYAGFGRFDWRITGTNRLAVRASYAHLETLAPDLGYGRAPGVGVETSGGDLSAGASLTSMLGRSAANELRLGFGWNRRLYETTGVPPLTTIAAGAQVFGADAGLPAELEHTYAQGSNTLHLFTGAHHFKVGMALSVSSAQQVYSDARGGAFTFWDAAQLSAGLGTFTQAVGTLPAADFSSVRLAGFLQDRLQPAPGLTVQLGVRYELETLPQGDVVPNARWRQLTGLSNDSVDGSRHQLAPRFSFAWEPTDGSGWSLRVDAGVYFDGTPDALKGDWVVNDGRVHLRRAVGDVGAWPAAPDSTTAPVTGPLLTLLAPAFLPPRSSRVSLGISRAIGSSAAVHLSGAYHRRDFLTRRSDLNLAIAESAVDQYGRAVYGTLTQLGGLLAVEPGSNRRFTEFDMVSAMNADGVGDRWEVSLAVERQVGSGTTLLAGYTYSITRDDWLGTLGAPADQLNPFPRELDGRDWARGVADSDVPHQLHLAARIGLLPRSRARLTAVYRYASGLPFTPGFPFGVDANGDGSGADDPAFVDDALAGMDELMREWPCLRQQSGRFAERNSCRTDGTHRLDARLEVDLARIGSFATALTLEGVNLIESDDAVVDRALVLVDPTGALDTSTPGVVRVPLMANPNFGQPVAVRTMGREVRVGMGIRF